MVDRSTANELSKLLEETKGAHHDATGGPDQSWVHWYAKYLEGRIDAHVGFSPNARQIAEWLVRAADDHEAEAPERRWATYYAESILDLVIDTSGKG